MARIYHSKNTRDSMDYPLEGVYTKEDAAKAFMLGQYELVAMTRSNDLDDAFELTQHIHESWTENEGVTPLKHRPRSTSVGDIIVNSEGAHIVAPVGFHPLSDEAFAQRVLRRVDVSMYREATGR
jgi:hypothetical protein